MISAVCATLAMVLVAALLVFILFGVLRGGLPSATTRAYLWCGLAEFLLANKHAQDDQVLTSIAWILCAALSVALAYAYRKEGTT